MKLWIDDIRRAPDDSWHVCRTVLAAIRALDMLSTQIDQISLDHDISHQSPIGEMPLSYPCEETFEAAARHIALIKRLHPEWTPAITLHTSNPVGAETMRDILSDSGIEAIIQLTGITS